MISVSQNIKNKLGVLNPLHLEVVNESHRHSVPDNAETHFKVVIVSENFVLKCSDSALPAKTFSSAVR